MRDSIIHGTIHDDDNSLGTKLAWVLREELNHRAAVKTVHRKLQHETQVALGILIPSVAHGDCFVRGGAPGKYRRI